MIIKKTGYGGREKFPLSQSPYLTNATIVSLPEWIHLFYG